MADGDKLDQLVALWRARRGSRRMPARRDFSVADFRPWLGHVGLFRVEGPPWRFRAALLGTAMVEYSGTDHTGRYLDEVVPLEAQERILTAYFECLRSAAPVAGTVSYSSRSATVQRLNRVLLPCAENGTDIDTIIAAVYSDRDLLDANARLATTPAGEASSPPEPHVTAG